MLESARFPYLATTQSPLPTDFMPFLPFKIEREGKSKEVLGLVDTGASVNVLPFQIGLEFDAVWEQQTTLFGLSGNLANYEARGLLLTATIANFPSVNLAFAWTRAENVPIILGQINFFAEFDVCFYGSQKEFEIKIKN